MATTRQFSLRVDRSLLDELDRLARQTGQTRTAVAERVLDEGVRMQKHPLIWFREGAAGRRPAIVGTRLDVWQVIETIRQNDNSVAAAAEYHEIPRSHVDACVAYYADYQAEVDEWTAQEHEFADRAEAAWRRGQQLFG